MNISLASMMATVEGYLSRKTVGIVPFTCSVDGYQLVQERDPGDEVTRNTGRSYLKPESQGASNSAL